jgi:CRISPR-associated endonuclease/helicase Cas3
MGRSMTKAERLKDMERVLIQRRWTVADLAERYEVHRSTIHRDFDELDKHDLPLKQDEEGRYYLDRAKYISSVRVNLHEALALYLAARRLFRQTRVCQPHVAEALGKLATALRQPMTEQLVRASVEVSQQAGAPRLVQVLETLVEGWAEGIKVRIRHQALHGQRAYSYVISPYLIEPSAWGDATYVIGHSDYHDGIATFKVERIEKAVLTTERYEIPDDFDEQELLRHAWGIWYSEEPTTVRLKFSYHVAQRVKESIWHLSERVEDTDDDGCIWTAKVGEVQEMVPWIRGWGADVEVLEPETLREALMAEAQRLALLYGLGEVVSPPLYQLLWAKTDKGKTTTHPLICHMIDVAQVTLALWNAVLTEGIRTQFADALGLGMEAAGRLIAFWAGLHDLGKASPAFQRRYPPVKAILEKELPFTTQVGDKPCNHGAITARTLKPLLVQETSLDENWAYNVSAAVGGHHGDWPTDLEQYTSTEERGDAPWDAVRRSLLLKFQEIFDPPPVTPPSIPVETENAFFTLLSGLTSVADWLGSMEDYFPPVSNVVDVDRYTERAAQQAMQALKETGWLGWHPPATHMAFEELCNVPAPRPLQETIIDLAPRLDRPALVIIEAPTGVGKTEAALYLADHWARTLQQRGAYIAMPTMATSNQMLKRFRNVLTERYPDKIVNYHLLHGDALLKKEDELPRLAKIEDGTQNGTVAALEWFTKRRRGLLAPFAVGTVDQALMSILQTRHFFIRLFGLSHKTVIFDEVHAYDTYMEELFYLLLRWLRVIGTSVVVLSATLPEVTRRRLVEAYTGLKHVSLPKTRYPAVTWTIGDQPHVEELESPPKRNVLLERIARQPEAITDRLAKELAKGGCAAVICNTVKRAQDVYDAICKAGIVPEDDLILFHAHFPAAWREEIEKRVLKLFGKPHKNGKDERPYKAIVVATQVIEQSLDLDFDLMVSDLAPVDLIIQRMGRLQRHDRGPRPTPRLLLAMPDVQDDVPQFGRGDVYVYGCYLLLRSYAVLHDRDCITTPTNVESLIESVYDPKSQLPALPGRFQKALDQARGKMEADQRKARREANSKLITMPDDWELLERPNACLEEDDPELHTYRQAATRLASPSITLICLHRTAHGLALNPEPDSPTVDIEQEPNSDTTRALFSRKISVMDPRLIKYFAGRPVPEAWRENPWLRYARLVEFEKGGVYRPENETWTLKLDRKLGLVMHDRV